MVFNLGDFVAHGILFGFGIQAFFNLILQRFQRFKTHIFGKIIVQIRYNFIFDIVYGNVIGKGIVAFFGFDIFFISFFQSL